MRKRTKRTKRSQRRTTKGYSMTAKASLVMTALMERVPKDDNSSNTWLKDGEKYFWERGREQHDGAMTGAVWQFLPNGLAKKVGTFRITSEGKIARFPATTKKQKSDAEKAGLKKYSDVFEKGDLAAVWEPT